MAQAPTSKITLVTGGARGIGLEICVLLAKAGFKVYGTLRNLKEAGAAEQRCKKENVVVHFLELDVTKDESVKKGVKSLIDKEKHIDILVNNAGVTLPACAVENTPLDDFRNVMEVNFFGVIRMLQAVLPHMRKEKNGLIVSITSCISLAGFPYLGGYTASKAALDRIIEAASIETKPFNIRFVEVSPGPVKTEFDARMVQYEDKNKEYENYKELIHHTEGILAMSITAQQVGECVVKVCKGEEKDFRVYPTEQNKQFHGIFCKDPTYSNYQNFATNLVTKKEK